MKVKELIEKLKDLPPETQVYLWLDGERHEIEDIDDSFVDGYEFVELNAGETT